MLFSSTVIAFIVMLATVPFAQLLLDSIQLNQILHEFSRGNISDSFHEDTPLSDRARRVSSMLMLQDDFDGAFAELGNLTSHSSDDGLLMALLLGRYHELRNEWLEAGRLYEGAGLIGLLERNILERGIVLALPREEITRRSLLFLALAEEHQESNDDNRAATLAYVARTINPGGEVAARAYLIEAIAALGFQKYGYAAAAVRQSLDINPPSDPDDTRYSVLFDAALGLVNRQGCKSSPTNQYYGLLTFYLAEQLNQSSECTRSLQASLLEHAPTETRVFLLLRLAFVAAREGDEAQASRLLQDAVSLGLPPVWQEMLLSLDRETAPRETEQQPNYVLADDMIAGYELDPLQVSLGIPVDLLLFYGGATAGAYRVDLVRLVNLAPDPGFEAPQESLCQLNRCIPIGFDTDLYNGSNATYAYKFLDGERPWAPIARDGEVASKSLALTNEDVPTEENMQSTSLISYSRYLNASKRYLYGGWLKSIGGNGYIGYCWKCAQSYLSYRYIVERYQADEWHYANQIVTVPAGSEASRLWLLNFDAAGSVLFDNVLFVELP